MEASKEATAVGVLGSCLLLICLFAGQYLLPKCRQTPEAPVLYVHHRKNLHYRHKLHVGKEETANISTERPVMQRRVTVSLATPLHCALLSVALQSPHVTLTAAPDGLKWQYNFTVKFNSFRRHKMERNC
jgi:hypothetical protein